MPKRSFSRKFKEEAAKLVLDDGLTLSEAEKRVGVRSHVIGRWVRAYRQEREITMKETSYEEALAECQRQIEELAERCDQLEEDKATLIRTIQIISQDKEDEA
ncbi:transposase [Marinobacter adhaerens]|uniref:transposase n=1 Tax=Marinobacter adhaerens TaxID=1033846 RepID=UPI003D2C2869